LAGAEGVWHYKGLFAARDRGLVREGTVYMALALLLWRLEGRLEGWGVSGPKGEAEVWG
jgi:hypothetical protein